MMDTNFEDLFLGSVYWDDARKGDYKLAALNRPLGQLPSSRR